MTSGAKPGTEEQQQHGATDIVMWNACVLCRALNFWYFCGAAVVVVLLRLTLGSQTRIKADSAPSARSSCDDDKYKLPARRRSDDHDGRSACLPADWLVLSSHQTPVIRLLQPASSSGGEQASCKSMESTNVVLISRAFDWEFGLLACGWTDFQYDLILLWMTSRIFINLFIS